MNKLNLKNLLITFVSAIVMSSSAAVADGHIKYTITSSNVAEYAGMLNPGQINMFAQYPDTYRIDVSEASPSCIVDPDISSISLANGSMVNDNEGIEVPNFGQTPFPDPSHPQHFVWNYRMYASQVSAIERIQTSTNVKADGSITLGQQETSISFPTNPRTKTMYADKNLYALFMQKNLGPPRTAGTVTLVHDFIDSYVQPRKAWVYSPATRRVRRAPNISYDTVTTAGGGIVTIDQFGGFNGAQDRYDWSYEGKQKMIVPFGNDAMANNPVADTHGVGHLNPDFVKFEELDVHVVHAQLKPGQRHLYESRTFYFLDGQPGLLVYQDMYDGNQELMRTYMQTHVVGGNNGNGLTTESMCTVQGEFTFDFATRTYSGGSIMGPAITPTATTYNGEEKPVSFYTPDGLRRYAR